MDWDEAKNNCYCRVRHVPSGRLGIHMGFSNVTASMIVVHWDDVDLYETLPSLVKLEELERLHEEQSPEELRRLRRPYYIDVKDREYHEEHEMPYLKEKVEPWLGGKVR